MSGRIESVNVRQFLFIVGDGKKYFAHANDLDAPFSGDLLGRYVEFEPAETDRGLVATKVRVR